MRLRSGGMQGMSEAMTATGTTVDVGGYRLYRHCAGAGQPTVVLDSGMSSTTDSWTEVQPDVARFTRVCAYDRAGLGRSDPGPAPRTSDQMVRELRALLRNAAVPGPYVLVGHSFGGLNAQLYAGRYPGEVAGMVLVDTAHEDHPAWLAAVLTEEQMHTPRRLWAGGSPEGTDFVASFDQARAARWRLDGPRVVLVRGALPPEERDPTRSDEQIARLERDWLELQAGLARRSPRGRLVVVEGSGHRMHRHRPDAIIAAIREVVDAVRRSERG